MKQFIYIFLTFSILVNYKIANAQLTPKWSHKDLYNGKLKLDLKKRVVIFIGKINGKNVKTLDYLPNEFSKASYRKTLFIETSDSLGLDTFKFDGIYFFSDKLNFYSFFRNTQYYNIRLQINFRRNETIILDSFKVQFMKYNFCRVWDIDYLSKKESKKVVSKEKKLIGKRIVKITETSFDSTLKLVQNVYYGEVRKNKISK